MKATPSVCKLRGAVQGAHIQLQLLQRTRPAQSAHDDYPKLSETKLTPGILRTTSTGTQHACRGAQFDEVHYARCASS